MREIDTNKESLKDFLTRPLLLVNEGYIGSKSDLTPIGVNIGYMIMGHNNALWLDESVSLNRIIGEPIRGYQVHSIFGLEYQFRRDLCQVILEENFPENFHLYEFDSDENAKNLLKKIRGGAEPILIK